MDNGKPVIADTVTGLVRISDPHIVHAVDLYRDREAWQRAQKNGYAIIRTLFNRTENGTSLIKRIRKCRENIETDRLNNFTGAMLRHHHHRSTEFMSRWIEAKNKEKP